MYVCVTIYIVCYNVHIYILCSELQIIAACFCAFYLCLHISYIVTDFIHIYLSIVRFTMNATQGSGSSSQQDSQSLPPQTESVNDSEPIQIDDDEPEDMDFGTKRKLTSIVWNDFKKVKVCGIVKAQCLHCHKQLGGKSINGTKHLHDHLKICTLKKIKLKGQQKPLEQSALRFDSKEGGKISVENYTFDPEVARKELTAMIVLHEYPLCIVDHAGFRRFMSALQPLFKMMTRNTIR